MSTGSTKLDKKPFDLLAWGYWFIYILIIPVAIYIINKPGSEIKIPLSKHNIPPYYVLTSNDVYMRQVDISEAPSDAVRDIRSLIGHYTLTALVADKPFSVKQIVTIPDPHLISKTLAIAISASSSMLLGGNLHPGDVVSITAVPSSNTALSPTVVFNAILVLDVKTAENETVVVLAIPRDNLTYYLAQTRNAMIVIARQVINGS